VGTCLSISHFHDLLFPIEDRKSSQILPDPEEPGTAACAPHL
jgi:hypothetical protein